MGELKQDIAKYQEELGNPNKTFKVKTGQDNLNLE